MAQRELKAVIDRIEEGKWAVLLVGQEQTERIVPVEQLPEDAAEGSWLKLHLDEETIRKIVVDAEETSALRSRMASKLDQLRSRQRHFQPKGMQPLQQRTPATPNLPDKGDIPAESKEAESKDVAPNEAEPKVSGAEAAKELNEGDENRGEQPGEEIGATRWKPFAQNEDFYDWEGYE